VIPRTEFEQSIDLDPSKGYGPSEAHVIYGVPCVHEYEPGFYLEATWESAEQTLRTERKMLAELDAKHDDEDAFGEAAWEEWREMCFSLEFAVTGLAEALCAAGCPTFSSCGGHPGDDTRSPHPWVVCGADGDRLPLLIEAMNTTGCSAEEEVNGYIAVQAPSSVESIALGFELLARRAQFDALPHSIDREKLGEAIEADWGEGEDE
jgi:hypothetical protein